MARETSPYLPCTTIRRPNVMRLASPRRAGGQGDVADLAVPSMVAVFAAAGGKPLAPFLKPWSAVPLWVPEVGGPIDPANEAHDMIMSTFGSISKGE
ncbi:hypothetical protein [Actinomadura spongiicola]|uniref:hypothetical protein n=1 Tax=Actinomadura spongiicola TaxID=2303421 RepID=UPI001314C6D0|nr:hypothetical protein [Actinomadura spongiicola]